MKRQLYNQYKLKNAEIIKENNNIYLSITSEFRDNNTIKTIQIPRILLSDDNLIIKGNDDIFITDFKIEFKVESDGIIFEEKIRELTKEEIEKELGYRIKII
jgi:hypothetical protein